jgi:hypothetical protein
MPRSVTTLVDQIIDAHPQVHGAGEITDLETIAATCVNGKSIECAAS